MRKLIKIENENNIYYFTSYNKAAKYIGCSLNAVRAVDLGHFNQVKGWSVASVDDSGDFLSKYINPETSAEEELREEILIVEKAVKTAMHDVETRGIYY